MKMLTIMALTLCLSGNAFAGHHAGKGDGNHSDYLDRLTKKLELSEQQASAVQATHEQYKAEKKALRERYRNDLREILTKEQLEKYVRMKEKRKQKGDKK